MIRLQYRIEVRMRNGRMPVHHFFDDLPDARKTDSALEECRHRDFVRGIHDSGQRATSLACSARQIQGWEIVVPRHEEFQF